MKTDKAQGAQLAKPPVFRVYSVQLVVLLIASALSWFAIDQATAHSMLIGGLISIAPNAYFAHYAFRYVGAQAAADIASSFYRGEAGKFLLTVLLFAGAFALAKPLHAPVVFLAFVVFMVLNGFLALYWLKR